MLHATLFIAWAFLYLLTFRPVRWDEKLMLVVYGLLMASAAEGVRERRGERARGRGGEGAMKARER